MPLGEKVGWGGSRERSMISSMVVDDLGDLIYALASSFSARGEEVKTRLNSSSFAGETDSSGMGLRAEGFRISARASKRGSRLTGLNSLSLSSDFLSTSCVGVRTTDSLLTSGRGGTTTSAMGLLGVVAVFGLLSVPPSVSVSGSGFVTFLSGTNGVCGELSAELNIPGLNANGARGTTNWPFCLCCDSGRGLLPNMLPVSDVRSGLVTINPPNWPVYCNSGEL